MRCGRRKGGTVDLSVSRSHSGGRDVLCVSDARTEQEAGRYDRRSGRLVVADQARVYEVVQALWDFLAADADADAGANPDPDPDAEPACPPCAGEPRSEAPGTSAASERAGVRDVAEAWDIPGIPDAYAVAGLPGAAGPAPRPPQAVPASAAGPKGKGGRVLDRRLGRLRRDGWAVLSPGGRHPGADFDRLVIGPPGVFAITVTRGGDAPPARAPSGSDGWDNSDGSGDDARFGRHDAQSAARMLSAACGMAIKVMSMLVFVGSGAEAIAAYGGPDWETDADAEAPGDVLFARGEDIADVLWGLPAVYSIQERKQIFDVARQAGLWRAA